MFGKYKEKQHRKFGASIRESALFSRSKWKMLIRRPFLWIVGIVLMIYVASYIAAYAWGILTAFKDRADYVFSPFGWPSEFHWENFSIAFRKLYVLQQADAGGSVKIFMPQLLLNSLVYAFVAALIPCYTSAVVAYVATQYKFKFSKVLWGIVIFTMVCPISNTLASQLQLYRALGVYDSFIGMCVIRISFTAQFILFAACFKGFSKSYAEAAFIDGASHTRVWFSIALPLNFNQFLILYLLMFIEHWGDWYWPMIFLPSWPTASYAIYMFQFSSDKVIRAVPYQFAAALMFSLPTVAIFLVFKNKMMGGLVVGGLKG